MMKVFENEFLIISIEEKNNLYVEKWLPATQKMTDKEWKESRIKLKEIFLKYKPNKILSLTKEFYFPISPELQNWLAINITEKIGKMIEKVALIVPSDIVAELGVQELMEEKATGQLVSKYFEQEAKAREWLIKEK